MKCALCGQTISDDDNVELSADGIVHCFCKWDADDPVPSSHLATQLRLGERSGWRISAMTN